LKLKSGGTKSSGHSELEMFAYMTGRGLKRPKKQDNV
jgi:hypothetical protein